MTEASASARDKLAALKARRGGERDGASNVRRRLLASAIKAANERLDEDGDQQIREGPDASLAAPHVRLDPMRAPRGPAVITGRLGHAHAAFTLSAHTREMEGRDGEPERLRKLVGAEAVHAPDRQPQRSGTVARSTS